ncbi:MAG: lmo0937 family membrane protein [Bacteroidota bacterium]|nr:lmo0937 family membrane protein [Bacteroidota bacterium]MDP4232647.1 lmo0937 family membrane protein [Bacteroidota bacterium]MDP4243899.1 lmo0937 family membrane protein [Bacteroidota bacterium]MDP4288432.1 lmo0937 family membrane protein [Bacteroidota bacterium]
MLWFILVLIIVAWLLGYTVFNIGALIHILFVIAIIVVLVRIIQGRRPI